MTKNTASDHYAVSFAIQGILNMDPVWLHGADLCRSLLSKECAHVGGWHTIFYFNKINSLSLQVHSQQHVTIKSCLLCKPCVIYSFGILC